MFYKYNLGDKEYLDGFFKCVFYESVAVAERIADYVTVLKEFAQNSPRLRRVSEMFNNSNMVVHFAISRAPG